MASVEVEIAPSELSLKQIHGIEEEERARRMKEGQHINETLLEVQDALVRLRAARAAHEAMAEEQAQRITEEKKHFVHEQLVRKTAQKEADQAMAEEQARRIAEDGKLEVHQQLVRKNSQKEADKQMDAEKQRRVTDGVAPDDSLKSILAEVRSEILKTFESPRYLKSAQEAKTTVNEELLRSLAAKDVAAAVQAEQTRLIEEPSQRTSDAKAQIKAVQDELVTKATLADVKSQEQREQERRVIEAKMKEIQHDLQRAVAAKEVDKASEIEREERILKDRLAAMQEDAMRKANSLRARHLSDEEQQRRINEDSVNKELASALSELHADLLKTVDKDSIKSDNMFEAVQSAMKDVLSSVKKLVS